MRVAACLSCESISSIDERNYSLRRQMFDIPGPGIHVYALKKQEFRSIHF